MSEDLEQARKNLLDDYINHPYKPFEFITQIRKPEPTNHSDPRMHLTLDDVKKLFKGDLVAA